MEGSDLESPQTIDLSTNDIKTEKIFVCEGIIEQEAPNDETSNNCSLEISNNDPIPGLDSFGDVIKTETFVPIEIQDNIEEEPLEILPIKMEDPFQADNSFIPKTYSPSKSSAAMEEKTMRKTNKKISNKRSQNCCVKPGAARKRQYAPEHLEAAVLAVKSNQMTQLQAKHYFGIPQSTISNRLTGKHCLGVKMGRKPRIPDAIEKVISECLSECVSYGFPFTTKDLQIVVRDVLNTNNIKIDDFKDNMPGRMYIKGFKSRFPKISMQRATATNIEITKNKISWNIVNEFFNNLNVTLDGIPPGSIFNYDETNISDNPGIMHDMFRKIVKYADNILNSTKTCISVMFAGAADGTLLHPMVVYKSKGKTMPVSWTKEGPKGGIFCTDQCCKAGSRYSQSPSGWFDSITFKEWFFNVLLPHAKNISGKKVLIGVNLSTHISPAILDACRQNNIAFVCLPLNSTSLMQPLNVALFGPMKHTWRQIVLDFKRENPQLSILSKPQFPRMLKTLCEAMKDFPNCLVSGFQATGIFPLDSSQVLKQLPRSHLSLEPSSVRTEFVNYLEKQRFGLRSSNSSASSSGTGKARRDRMVVPGSPIILPSSTDEPSPHGGQICPLTSEENDEEPDQEDRFLHNLDVQDEFKMTDEQQLSRTRRDQFLAKMAIGDLILIKVSGKTSTETLMSCIKAIDSIEEVLQVGYLAKVLGTDNMFVIPDTKMKWHSFSDVIIQKIDIYPSMTFKEAFICSPSCS